MSTDISFASEQLTALSALLEQSKRIVIFPHTAPDGDALGAVIAWASFVHKAYPDAEVHIISPDPIERYLRGIPGLEGILIYPEDEARALSLIAQADLLCHLDHNQIARLRYAPLIRTVEASSARRLLIDHHLHPEECFDVSLSYPACSSTCELVYLLIDALGSRGLIDARMATALCFGIVTDTGRFMYGCFAPSLYCHFADLISLGADYAYIIDQLSYHGTEQELRLKGYVLHEKLEFYPELGAAVIMLSREEMQARGISKGDTEGLVNLPLSVEGIDCVAFIREDKTQVKLSLRSLGDFPINELAMKAFGGGGHRNAAGAEYQGSPEEARQIFLDALRELRQSLV